MLSVPGIAALDMWWCGAKDSPGGALPLAGDLGRFGPGDRVRVRGTSPDMSICQQGTTIEVQSIEAAR